jgi:WD40-like Beta Propeller Repeat/Bacterial TSP3 repeat
MRFVGISIIAFDCLVIATKAAPAQAISERNVSVPVPAGGDGTSVAPLLSADGRFVVFSSAARNLLPASDGLLGLNVFVRDRSSNSISLVSANLSGNGGGNFSSELGGISTNGQFVIFESEANKLVAGDTNGVKDIFLRDLQAGTTRVISIGTNGWGNAHSWQPAITPDGHWAVFVSLATNLVAGDTNNAADIFVADLPGNTLSRASVGDALPPGRISTGSATPVITTDGRYVAFATGLTGVGPQAEIFVRDMLAGTTSWASSNAAAMAMTMLGSSNFPCSHPVLSDAGQFVAFKIGSSNGIGNALILQTDLSAGTTTMVATNAMPQLAYADEAFGPEMTPDGRFIIFSRRVAANSTSCNLYVWDAQSGTETLISADLGGNLPTNAISKAPAITPDGRFVTFISNGTNLTQNIISNGFHIYLRDVQAGLTMLIDVDTNGVGSTLADLTVPVISADGRYVAFSIPDGGLVASDNNRFEDVFVCDVVAGQTELISKRDSSALPATGNYWSWLSQTAVSDDSLRLTFASYATDLLSTDNNGTSDIFVRDLSAGTNFLVTVGNNGQRASGGFSASPVLSGNGRFVAFLSTATNLFTGQVNRAVDVFVRDLDAGTNILVSASTTPNRGGNNDSSSPLISADGRYVAFLSKASDLTVGGAAGTFWRDLTSGTVSNLTGSSSLIAPSMSADGKILAYLGGSSGLTVRNMSTGMTISNIVGLVTSAALSPTGRRLLYTTTTGVVVTDLLLASNLFSCTLPVPIRNSNPWSADEQFVVFATKSNLVLGDANAANDIYLYNLSNGQITLVSLNLAHTGSANGASDSPSMGGDGRSVIYRSFATDITSTPANIPNVYVFDRFTGSNSVLASAASAGGWSSWISKPALNGDGRMAIFQSPGSGIVAGDLNRTQDVFLEPLAPWGAADTDGDGIPDAWLQHYFGHATGQSGDLSRAHDDAGGDGMTNFQEYLAGTDPLNPASSLRLVITPRNASDGMVTLNWQVSPGKHYSVLYKDNLSDLNWQEASGNAYVIGTQGYFRITPNQSSRYYRLALGN